jgi:hypothetical protein
MDAYFATELNGPHRELGARAHNELVNLEGLGAAGNGKIGKFARCVAATSRQLPAITVCW